MEASELLEIVARNEDGQNQFKGDVDRAKDLGEEIVAFANSGGGRIFIGVDSETASLRPHDNQSVERLNQLISNAATTCVCPPINVSTENIETDAGVVIVIRVPDGLRKPYTTSAGQIFVKNGSDKRKVTAAEEMQRMFQASGLVHADDQPIRGSSVADIDTDYFASFYGKRFDEQLDENEQPIQQVLANMRLLRDDMLTLTGVLLFGNNPHSLLPAFHVKAVSYPGTEIDVENYLDSEDFTGKLDKQFEGAMGFVRRNLRKTQQGQGINASGELEIPSIVFEEIIANALIHRDFFISAPIRIFIFGDRIEIISPGVLPNSLTIDNILSGNSNMRNPTLASYATHILPYRGIGSGIIRAKRAYTAIHFINDTEGNIFRVVIDRPKIP